MPYIYLTSRDFADAVLMLAVPVAMVGGVFLLWLVVRSVAELRHAVIEGAVQRLRPKLLTEGVAIIALAPMLWATGVGHEVISARAAPVLGGLLIADEAVGFFIPVRFYWVRRHRWLKLHGVAVRDAGRVVLPTSSLPSGIS